MQNPRGKDGKMEVFTYRAAGDPGTFHGRLQGKGTVQAVTDSKLTFTIKDTQEENDGEYECHITGDKVAKRKTQLILETYSKYLPKIKQ